MSGPGGKSTGPGSIINSSNKSTPEATPDSVSIGKQNKHTNQGEKLQYLKIISTNDIHGHLDPVMDNKSNSEVGGMASLGAAIKKEEADAPHNTILLDAGDITDGGAVSDYFDGLPMVKAMNEIGYDVMTAGNHDVKQGIEGLRNIIQTANFPVLSANLVDSHGEDEHVGTKPYVILEPEGVDIKVGVLGLTTPDTASMLDRESRERFSFLDPQQTARENIARMKKEGAGLIILLSHLGIESDREMARNVDGIDIIVGGHSHTELETPEKINDTLITQTGKFGKNYGKIEVSFVKSEDGAKIRSVTSTLHKIEPHRVRSDRNIYKIADKYNRQLKPIMKRRIGTAPADLMVRDYQVYKEESALNNFICDSLRKKTGADIFIHATSALRSSLSEGDVTVEDIFKILPWKNEVSIVQLKGKHIKQILEEQLSGPAHCSAQSGLKMVINTDAPRGSRLVDVKMQDGSPLEDDRVYTVATEDKFADGSIGMYGFRKALSRKDTGVDIREMLIEAIEEKGKVTSGIDGRMINLAGS